MITEVEEEDTHTEKDRKNKKRTCWWRVLLEQLPTRWDAATRKRCHFGARLPAFRFPALSTDWFPLLILGVDSLLFFLLFFFFFNFFHFFFLFTLFVFLWTVVDSLARLVLAATWRILVLAVIDWLILFICCLFRVVGFFFEQPGRAVCYFPRLERSSWCAHWFTRAICFVKIHLQMCSKLKVINWLVVDFCSY